MTARRKNQRDIRCRYCPHPASSHKPFLSSGHPGFCGTCACWHYDPEYYWTAAWRWWRAAWHWPNDPPDRENRPVAETVTLRPRPVPLPLPEQDGSDDKTRFDLRVAGYIDTGERPRGMHRRSAPWEA